MLRLNFIPTLSIELRVEPTQPCFEVSDLVGVLGLRGSRRPALGKVRAFPQSWKRRTGWAAARWTSN